MKISKKFKKKIIEAILEDGTLSPDTDDWWTSFTDEKNRVFDVNVYDNSYHGDLQEDEVAVSIFDCFYHEDDDVYVTDFENSVYTSFIVKRDILLNGLIGE